MSMLVSAWTFLFKLRNVKMSNSSSFFYRKPNHNTALEQIGMVSFTRHLSSTFNFSLSYAAFNQPLCRTTSLRRKLHSCMFSSKLRSMGYRVGCYISDDFSR